MSYGMEMLQVTPLRTLASSVYMNVLGAISKGMQAKNVL